MKKSWLSLLLALALAMCLACGAALAEEAVIEASVLGRGTDSDSVVNAIVSADEGDWYYDTYAGGVVIDENSYAALRDSMGGAPEWSLADGSGLDVWLETDGGDNAYCTIRINGAPENAGNYPVTVACDWGDAHQEFTLNVRYENVNGAPDGGNIPPVINIREGEPYNYTFSFNNDFFFKGEYWMPMGLDDDAAFEDYFDLETNGSQATITPHEGVTGWWYGWLNYVDANVGVTRPVIFRVEDENGEVDNWPMHFDEYDEFAGLSFAIFQDEDNVSHDNWVYDFESHDYERLRDIFGEPSWWVETLPEPEGGDPAYRTDVQYHLEPRDENDPERRQYLWIDETPAEAGYTLFRVGNLWEDDDLGWWFGYTVFRINWETVNDLPKVTNIPLYLDMTAGQETEFNFAYTPDIAFQSRDRFNWNLDDDDLSNHGIEWWEDGFNLYITANEPGLYPAWINMIRGNMVVYSPAILRVADENGNVPAVDMGMQGEATNEEFAAGLPIWDGTPDTALHVEDLVARAWVDTRFYDIQWKETYELPNWTVEQTGGDPIDFHWEGWTNTGGHDSQTIDIHVDQIPDQSCSLVFTATCSWNGHSASVDIPVTFTGLILPTKFETDDEVFLTAGQRGEVHYILSPSDWNYTGARRFDAHLRDMYGNDKWIGCDYENGKIYITVDEPGVYRGWICLRDGSVNFLYQPVIFRVADEDGNQPEDIPQLSINGEEGFSIDFALFDEIETEGCWMWHDHWINSFNVDHYDELRSIYDCEPEWDVHWAEDSDIQDKAIDLSVYDGNSGADLWLQEYPDQPCTGKLILTVRWADQEINYPIYVNYRYPDSLPTGMNGPDEVHVYMHGDSPVSKWDSVEVTFADGFSFGSRTMLYVHKDAADHMEFYNDWGSNTIYFNGKDPGTYFGQLEIRDGNIALSKDVIFIIHNEDGTAPDEIHPAFTDESAYECTYTRAAFEDGQFYYHDGWVRNYEIANWEVFAIQRHTHPVWTAEIIGDDHGAEIWFNTWDWEGLTATRGFDVGFNNEPTEPCTIRYKVTCTWDNDVIEGYCTLNYVTPDSLPGNPLDLPTEFHGLRAGEEFGYPVEVLGGYEFGDPDHVRVMITADFADGHHWEWGDNGQRWQFFTPRDSGTFRGSSGLVFENIRLDQEILFFVEDENGGEQSAEPNLGELQETVTVPYAPIIEWNDFPDGYYIGSDIWSGSIGNYDELRELYGCEPEWQFDYDENCDADIVFEPMDEGRWANIDIHHQPSQPMEADYTVRVNWGPYSVEKTLHVVFQDMGIPQGLKLDAPDTLFLQPGQSKSYTVGYTPADWEGYGDFRYLDIGASRDTQGLTFSTDQDSKTVTITAVDPGVYEVWIDYGFGGGISTGAVLTNMPIMRVIVPDGDGTLFTLSATEIMTGDQVTAQVYARGAERIRLSKVNGNGDTVHTFEQEGYSGIDYDMGEWWPGVFTVTAEAFYADQDAWQQVGDPIELTVTTHGDMDFFASELPALVWAGDESIVFRFDDCGNIVGGEYEDAPDGWYKVCINDTMQPGYVVNYDYDWNDAGEHAVTPDMYLDGRTLEAGHVYWFGMGAWRPHYTPGGSIEIHTAVVDPGKVLRLPAGLTEIDEEAFAGTSAQAVFIPASVTSIGSRAFADSAIVYAQIPEGLDIGNAFEGCHGDVVIEVYGIK